MRFEQLEQLYKIEFVYNNGENGREKSSECQYWNDYGIGVNNMPYDQRGAHSKRAMVHSWESNKGYWTISKNDDRTTYSIEFVSSIHGRDTEYAKYGLGMIHDDDFSEMEKRSKLSQFVMAHKDESKKGKWLILPAEKLGGNKDNGAADRLFDIVFVSCNDGSNTQFAGYRLALGELQQDTRDAISRFVMATNHEDHRDSSKWRITRTMGGACDWLLSEGIFNGVSPQKKAEISLFLQDDAGVDHPEEFLELKQDDPECFESFVKLLPSVNRKRFHKALEKCLNKYLTMESFSEGEGGWCHVLDYSDKELTKGSSSPSQETINTQAANIETAYARMTCCEDFYDAKKPKFGASKFKFISR